MITLSRHISNIFVIYTYLYTNTPNPFTLCIYIYHYFTSASCSLTYFMLCKYSFRTKKSENRTYL